MLATPGTLPTGKGYAFEYKWDGIRALVLWDTRSLRVLSRNGRDITLAFPELAPLAEKLGARSAVLDGEIVALNEQGRPEFGLLQQRLGRVGEGNVRQAAQAVPASYVLFDLLHLDGKDLMDLPYRDRRKLLRGLRLKGPSWTTPAEDADGEAMLASSQELGLEGVVAKKLDSRYVPGLRSESWIKVRNRMRQEFVIGGWTEGQGSRGGTIGALLMGHYGSDEDPKKLVYVGRCGSGLGGKGLVDLEAKLARLAVTSSPFDSTAADEEGLPGVHFVKAMLVGEVEFSEITREGRMRQPAFKGLRTDKKAREVVWEQATPRPPRRPAGTPIRRWRKSS